MSVGVDFASVDKNKLDLQKAKKDGNLAFTIIRATEGTWQDPDYHANFQRCVDAQVPVSPYTLIKFGGSVSPETQIDAFTAYIGTQTRRSLVPCIDVEIPGGRHTTGLTAQEALDWLRRAWNHLSLWCGSAPLIYTSAMFWQDPDGMNNLPAPDLASSPMWVKYWPYPEGSLAVYDPKVVASLGNPAVPTPWGTQWVVQQYQGDAIHYPGFSSTVDMDRMLLVSYGAQGDTVKWIQRRVGTTADGIFGLNTKAAVMTFQQSHGLQVDGVVGYATFSCLSWHNPL